MKGLVHKLLDDVGADPGCPQPHVDFGGIKVLGLGGGQGLHVDLKSRVIRSGQLGDLQFVADVAGQILVGSFPVLVGRVLENHPAQLLGNAPEILGRAQ